MPRYDTSIYQTNPLRSVADYAAQLDASNLRKQGMQRNALALRAGELGLADRERAIAEQNQMRNALGGLGSNATDEQRVNALRGLGTSGGFTAADALEKSIIERNKTKAETAARGEETLAKRATLYRQGLDLVGDPQAAAQWLQAQYQDPLMGAHMMQVGGPFEQTVQRIPQDPAGFQQWRQMAAMGMEKFIQSQTQQRGQDITSQTQLATNAATNARAAADAAAGRAVTMRGQDLTNTRATEANATQIKELGKPPPGYIWGPPDPTTGLPTQSAAKGGPADLKIAGQLNQDTQALTGAVSSFDRLAAAANEVLTHPGLNGITGKMGAIPNIPGGQAANAEALLGTLKSQVGFGVLQDLRNNSKTGGALGAVSDAEGKRLEANLAALDKSQSLEQFQSNLKKIIDYADKAKDRMREAYNLKHGDRSTPSAQSGEPKKVNSMAEAMALPPGAVFIDPNGVKRTR